MGAEIATVGVPSRSCIALRMETAVATHQALLVIEQFTLELAMALERVDSFA